MMKVKVKKGVVYYDGDPLPPVKMKKMTAISYKIFEKSPNKFGKSGKK